MKRILGIDYGLKRTGLAISDPLGIIASPLETIETKNLLNYILDLNKKEKISVLVIGLPLNLKNKLFDIEENIKEFIQKIKTYLPEIEIERIDERFTSKMAFQTMIDAGVKQRKRRDKGLVDKISATLILQSFLDARK